MNADSLRSGMVALVGRPNVGKSTLLNRLVGHKVSIVTRKPQTTRQRICGVLNRRDAQIVFVDTPGMHRGARALNRAMNRAAADALADVDLIAVVVTALQWTQDDQRVVEAARAAGPPVMLVVNKIDRVGERARLLPWLERHGSDALFTSTLLVSARNGSGVDDLAAAVEAAMPPGPPLYPQDQITDRDERFRVAELIREQLTERLHQELPYGICVLIERFDAQVDGVDIDALVWVDKPSHKGMVIGAGGKVLKQVGTAVRAALEAEWERRVRLGIWVKPRPGWTDDEERLRQQGLAE